MDSCWWNNTDAGTKNRIIRVFKQACTKLHARGLAPKTWARDIDPAAAEFVYYELEKAFFDLRLCADHWKARKVCTTYFPTWKKPEDRSSKKRKVAHDSDADDDEGNDDTAASNTAQTPPNSHTSTPQPRPQSPTDTTDVPPRSHTPPNSHTSSGRDDDAMDVDAPLREARTRVAGSSAPRSHTPPDSHPSSIHDDNATNVDVPAREVTARVAGSLAPDADSNMQPGTATQPTQDLRRNGEDEDEEEEPSLLDSVRPDLRHDLAPAAASPGQDPAAVTNGDDAVREAQPLPDADVYIPPFTGPHVNHAKTLHGRVWKEKNPMASKKAYDKYWAKMTREEKQPWIDQQNALRKAKN
ncbi:unnamed protein product [Peniophora sp. CBMAI 1063]|nr:unnamed protein product [Peniophora sp. CBMAI 1063]